MVTLLHGDCLELMKGIPDGSVDMVLCDLPYGTTDCPWDVVIPFGPLWDHWRRVCKPTAAIVLFGRQPFTADLVRSNPEWFRYELIWEKSRAGNSMQVTRRPAAVHENIEVFYKEMPTYNEQRFRVDEKYIDKRKSINDSFYSSGHYSGVMHRKADDGWRHPQSVLPFNSVWEKGMHPTQKPVPLLEYLIKTYSNPGDTVLDNTMGSGSTGVACVNTGRDFIGIELDEGYFRIAERRIADAQRDKSEQLFNNGD